MIMIIIVVCLLILIGSRKAGEFLHQRHEILRVRVNDFGRMRVDDHGVALLLLLLLLRLWLQLLLLRFVGHVGNTINV